MTGALNPPETVVVTVDAPLAPFATETVAGATETVKDGGTVTVNVTVEVCTTLPPVAVTVIVYGPTTALAATAIVMVDEPDPGALIAAGLKVTVTPAG